MLSRAVGKPFTRQQVWDAGLILVLIAIAQEEIWVPQYSFNNRVGPVAMAIAATTLTAVLQFWRRREPLLILAAVAAVTLIRARLGGGVTGLGFLAPILVDVYSVGRYERRLHWVPAAAVSAVLAVGATSVDSLLDPTHSTGGGFIAFTYLFMAVIWGLGRLLLGRESASLELAERAESLQRDRDAQAREAVAEERARIARELHDVVAHNVSVIIAQAQAASALLDKRPDAAKKPLLRIETTAREAMAEMRRLVGILDEADGPGVGPQPGLPQLPELFDRVREAGLAVEFESEGDVSDLPGGLNLAAYRVVQEALTNVLRHAGASVVRVRVRRSRGVLTIDVVDDGHEISPRKDGGGRGLIGMRQRVALYGGRIDLGSHPGGFSINVMIPLESATA
jgi:signal transduction histidine kinase